VGTTAASRGEAALRILLSNASPAWGGVHTVTETLVRGLGARGHEIVLLCRPGSPLEERMRGLVPLVPILRGMDLSPPTLARVGAAVRRFRPEVALTLTKKDVRLTAPVARALGVPVVVRHANDQPLRGGAFGRFLYGRVPALHVANAGATRRTILRSAPWLAPERVAVVRNGVDAERFASARPADLGVPPGGLAVGYLGSFEPRKGVPDLLEAWARVAPAAPRAHLLLVGRGSQEAALRERMAGLPRARIVGYRSDVPEVMRALDLLVLPSYVEGAPNVVLEAMAAGLPAVATAVSGTPELVVDGVTGRLGPSGDPDALAEALAALLADPGLRARMGAAGAARVRSDFTVSGMIEAYENLLLRAARGGR